MAELNLALFQKVRDRIAEIPESFEQSRWITRRSSSPYGYAACLAGETIICAAPTVEQGLAYLKRLVAIDEEKNTCLVPDSAGGMLGLDGSYTYEDGEHDIFVSSAQLWPEPFRSQFTNGDESGAAVAYLDWIIANNRIFPEEDE
jgi:hypothetical protein